VLGEFARQNQTNGGLDLAGRDGVALVVASQTSTLGGNALEQIVHCRQINSENRSKQNMSHTHQRSP
jgi:hypothetical protein